MYLQDAWDVAPLARLGVAHHFVFMHLPLIERRAAFPWSRTTHAYKHTHTHAMTSLELSHKLIAPFLVPFLISTLHLFLIEEIVSCSIAIFHCDMEKALLCRLNFIYIFIYYIYVCV